jgi:hypothetical protein
MPNAPSVGQLQRGCVVPFWFTHVGLDLVARAVGGETVASAARWGVCGLARSGPTPLNPQTSRSVGTSKSADRTLRAPATMPALADAVCGSKVDPRTEEEERQW